MDEYVNKVIVGGVSVEKGVQYMRDEYYKRWGKEVDEVYTKWYKENTKK